MTIFNMRGTRVKGMQTAAIASADMKSGQDYLLPVELLNGVGPVPINPTLLSLLTGIESIGQHYFIFAHN